MYKKKMLTIASGMLVLLILIITLSISRLERPSQEYSQQIKKLPYTFDFGTWSNPNPSTVGFDGPFPEMPSKMMVYKVVHPNNINEAYVRELANKHFGMSPDAKFEKKLVSYQLKTSNQWFQFNPQTGSFNIRKINEIDTRSITKNDYPSNQDCNIIAVKYLRSCKLYEADAYFRGITDNTKSSDLEEKLPGIKPWELAQNYQFELDLVVK
jgi:hypothetical protein